MVFEPSKNTVCKYCEDVLSAEYKEIGVCQHCLNMEDDYFYDDDETLYRSGVWDLRREDDY